MPLTMKPNVGVLPSCAWNDQVLFSMDSVTTPPVASVVGGTNNCSVYCVTAGDGGGSEGLVAASADSKPAPSPATAPAAAPAFSRPLLPTISVPAAAPALRKSLLVIMIASFWQKRLPEKHL